MKVSVINAPIIQALPKVEQRILYATLLEEILKYQDCKKHESK